MPYKVKMLLTSEAERNCWTWIPRSISSIEALKTYSAK